MTMELIPENEIKEVHHICMVCGNTATHKKTSKIQGGKQKLFYCVTCKKGK